MVDWYLTSYEHCDTSKSYPVSLSLGDANSIDTLQYFPHIYSFILMCIASQNPWNTVKCLVPCLVWMIYGNVSKLFSLNTYFCCSCCFIPSLAFSWQSVGPTFDFLGSLCNFCMTMPSGEYNNTYWFFVMQWDRSIIPSSRKKDQFLKFQIYFFLIYVLWDASH